MNKTPYPTNLEIVLFLADVLDVREKGKGIYKASKKPLRHFVLMNFGEIFFLGFGITEAFLMNSMLVISIEMS